MAERAVALTRADLTRDAASFLALGGGAGLAPRAPGTLGTLVGIPLLFLLPASPWLHLVLVGVLFGVGVWCCGRCAESLGVHDHGGIVWDEIVGYLLVMVAVPRTIVPVVLGFVLFRLFDVWKPWPIGDIDRRVHGGLGIMLDDVLAAVYAALALHLVLALFPGLGGAGS